MSHVIELIFKEHCCEILCLSFGALNFIDKPLTLYCDNQDAIFFFKHDRLSKGAKHTELKYSTLKQDAKREKLVIKRKNVYQLNEV